MSKVLPGLPLTPVDPSDMVPELPLDLNLMKVPLLPVLPVDPSDRPPPRPLPLPLSMLPELPVDPVELPLWALLELPDPLLPELPVEPLDPPPLLPLELLPELLELPVDPLEPPRPPLPELPDEPLDPPLRPLLELPPELPELPEFPLDPLDPLPELPDLAWASLMVVNNGAAYIAVAASPNFIRACLLVMLLLGPLVSVDIRICFFMMYLFGLLWHWAAATFSMWNCFVPVLNKYFSASCHQQPDRLFGCGDTLVLQHYRGSCIRGMAARLLLYSSDRESTSH